MRFLEYDRHDQGWIDVRFTSCPVDRFLQFRDDCQVWRSGQIFVVFPDAVRM